MKKIVKNFNNLIKKTIFKVQNKTNNNFKISNFNKFLIIIVSSLFFYLFYLSIPLLYEKSWVQASIERKLLNEFKLNLSTSADISYRILPAPHFLIKDSKILIDKKSIAEVKNLKVFLSQGNFFSKEKVNFKEVVIENVNFSLLRDNLTLIDNISMNQFSDKKITVNNSNVFFKNNLGETIAILKIFKALLFFDGMKFLNIFDLGGEIFNIPFTLNLENKIDSPKNRKIKFDAEKLRLTIFNESFKTNQNSTSGKNTILFLNSIIKTKYDVKEELIIFTSNNSKRDNLKKNFSGKLSINPFDLDLNINLDNYKISKLFKISPIINELLKSELLFNNNISLNASMIATNSNAKEEIFQYAKINFHIINGKIDFNKTRLINDQIGSLELSNSNLFLKNNRLILNTNLLIDIDNIENLFSFLNTSKSSRKKIENILINLDYDFTVNQIKVNTLKINNNEVSDKLLRISEGFNDNNFNNLTKSRRLINQILEAYDG